MSESVPPAVPPSVPAAETSKPAAAEKPSIKYEDFAKLDLRVAHVIAARPHPNADRLLLLQVRVGTVEKQIVAGIKAKYPPEEMVGKQIVIVDNLEPAMLRGEESLGMLLAASDANGVSLLTPDRPLESGSKVK